jgi:RES domain-containing protein
MSAALKVVSRVIPREHNFLLNPQHPDFGGIEVDDPLPFHFDPRLFR